MRAIRYHDEARLELVHEVSYYAAVSARAMSRFQLKVKPVVEMIMRPFSIEREQVEAHG